VRGSFKTIIIKSQEQMLNECAETMNAVMRGEQVVPQERNHYNQWAGTGACPYPLDLPIPPFGPP